MLLRVFSRWYDSSRSFAKIWSAWVEQLLFRHLLWRHLVALYKFTGIMCFFPDSFQLLYFHLKDNRSLFLFCSKYHQLASLGTYIFPISDSSCRDADKRYFKFPVYPPKLVLLTTSFPSDFHYELQSHQLDPTVSLELCGQLNIFFIIARKKPVLLFSFIKHFLGTQISLSIHRVAGILV